MTKNNSPNSSENGSENKIEEIYEINIDKLENFENHPYEVRKDKMYLETKDSIEKIGVSTPIIVRPKGKDKFEIISGHRRKHICKELGITKIPCIIRDLDDDTATIQMVDCNAQRDTVLLSEKAKAYKMKLDAIKHQGKKIEDTSRQVDEKLLSVEKVGKKTGDSARQVQRIIRLNELVPKILNMVDMKKIAFNPAVNISYLTEKEQDMVLDTIETYSSTPSLSQAKKLKKLSQEGKLKKDKIEEIMLEDKGYQIKPYQLPYTKVKKCVPRNVETVNEVETYLLKCAKYCTENKINLDKVTLDNEPKAKKSKDRGAR